MSKRDPVTRGTSTQLPDTNTTDGPDIRIQLLDGFSVHADGAEPVGARWRLARARSLVALLALSPGHRRHREELTDLLWPEADPETGFSNLRYALHIARRTLAPLAGDSQELILRNGDFIEFDGRVPVVVDVDEFERASDLALRTEDPVDVRGAIELYRGELLPDDRFDDWVIVKRERLRGQFLSLLEAASSLADERGDTHSAIVWTERLLDEDHLDEEAHRRLMRLYADAGRRSEALRQYRILEIALREDLDVEPDPGTRQLYADIRAYRTGQVAHLAGTSPGDAGSGAGLPPLPRYQTSFIGRKHDLDTLAAMLREHRLVTLFGPGGVGKTRLAMEFAAVMEEHVVDGVRIVDLSSVHEAGLIWPAILAAFGLSEEDSRADTHAVASRETLLLIDNCEHLSAGVAEVVTALLTAAPHLQILTTSREVLHVAGEAVWSVSPLDVPESGPRASIEDVRCSAAAQLFLDRLTLRHPQVDLTADVARCVAEICRQLDGLPLAIEMAAARAASIALPDLSARLADAPRVLASSHRDVPGRHETLMAMLDWSYELLNPVQQHAFARLAVFPGSWSLEQAELVVVDEAIHEADVLDAVSELVDKSLLVRNGDVLAASYRFLAPVRQYAAMSLDESGDGDTIRRRHAEVFLSLAEAAVQNLRGPQQSVWMETLERSRDNFRYAISWSLSSDPGLALRLAVSLGRFWYLGGYLREGRQTLDAVLEATPDEAVELRAKAMYLAGILADEAGDQPTAEAFLQDSLVLFREFGQPSDISSVMNSLGVVAWASDDLEQASTLLHESLAIRRTLGDPKLVASTLGNLALIEWSRGNLQAAWDQQSESLALARESGDEWSAGIGTAHLGRISWEQGDYWQAREMFTESLRIAEQVGDRGAVAEGLEGVAGALAALRRDCCFAARLWGAAEAHRESLDLPVPPQERPLYERMVAVGRAGVGEVEFEAAWQHGRRSDLETLVGEVLATDQGDLRDGVPDAGQSLLTSRQREIAGLIARDLTNQQIADELGIAHRTVDTHVSNILQSLGCRSRSEVARLLTG